MANQNARGNAPEQDTRKQEAAQSQTKSGEKKDREGMQAGSGGRGGHRRRKGGAPDK